MASRWFSAVRQGHLSTIRKLRTRGAAVDSRNRWGQTALMIAAGHRQADTVRVLLDLGADPNSKDRASWTAMTHAVDRPSPRFPHARPGVPAESSREIWELLRSAGGKARLREAVILGDVAMARELCDAGGEPDGDARWCFHDTYLMVAADLGHLDIVQFLLARGVDIEGTDDLGSRALHRASMAGHIEIVRLLVDRGADLDGGDRSDTTPLAEAATNGQQPIIDLLLSLGARRSLLDAVALNDVDLVEHLLHDGGDPNQLHYGAGRLAMYAVERGHPAIVRALMDHGANHFEAWIDDRPLIAQAARGGHPEIVRLLIERGADLHQVGRDRQTALAWAIREGRDEVVAYVKQAGAVR